MSEKLATSSTMLITNSPIANNESMLLYFENVDGYDAIQYHPRVHGKHRPHGCIRVAFRYLVFIYQRLFTKGGDVKFISRFIIAHRQVRAGYPVRRNPENARLIGLFVASRY